MGNARESWGAMDASEYEGLTVGKQYVDKAKGEEEEREREEETRGDEDEHEEEAEEEERDKEETWCDEEENAGGGRSIQGGREGVAGEEAQHYR